MLQPTLLAVQTALCIFACATAEQRSVLALWNLEGMTECRLHYNALHYDDYGCWCGVGGCCMPEDGIDNCCMHHDHCYDAAISSGACYDVPVEYFDNYHWSCVNGQPVCAENQHGCSKALCACDEQVVDCWSQFPEPTSRKKCTHKPLNGTQV